MKMEMKKKILHKENVGIDDDALFLFYIGLSDDGAQRDF